MKSGFLKVSAVLLFCLGIIFTGADRALAVPSLTLDGKFNDWTGRTNMWDSYWDSSDDQDIYYLYWGTNEGESNLYYMVQRYAPWDEYSQVTYTLRFDINDNGKYNDTVDRRAVITYQPYKRNGYVTVRVYTAAGALITTISGYWGESARNLGRKCEFNVSMSSLGIYPAQPIRFYITSNGYPADRVPDSGDIQWSPVPAAGALGLAALAAGGVVLLLRAVRLKKPC